MGIGRRRLYVELTGGKFPVQKDGMVALPEGNGLGLTVDFAEFKKRYPYRHRYVPASLPIQG